MQIFFKKFQRESRHHSCGVLFNGILMFKSQSGLLKIKGIEMFKSWTGHEACLAPTGAQGVTISVRASVRS